MKKRIISTILSLCMVLSLLPARVLAQELTHLSHAVVQETALHSGAVQSGRTSRAADVGQLQSDLNDPEVDTVQVDINIDVDKTLEVTREVTLDLNGNVLYSTGGGSVFVIKDGGHLTLIDSATDAEHKFTPNADGLWVWDERDGTETVRGGIITGGTGTEKYYSAYGGGVLIEDGGRFTMNGGSIVGCKADGAGGGVKVEGYEKSGIFEMNDGAIIGCVAPYGGGVETDYYSNTIYGKFIMNGGVIDSCVATEREGGGVSASAPFVMEGGEIKNCVATNGEGGGVFLGNSRSPHTLNGTINAGTATDQKYVHLNNSDAAIGANANIHANITLEGGMIALADGVSSATVYGKITNDSYGGAGCYADGLVAVTYQVNGADYATQIVRSGGKATQPVAPTVPAGQNFNGWFKADGTRWDFTTAVTEDITLTGWPYTGVVTETELNAALADDTADVIRLTQDVNIGSSLTILRKVTLDLNGHVLKMTGSGSVIKIGSTGNLTVIDSGATVPHKFKVDGTDPWVLDETGGTKAVRGGVITGGTGLTDGNNSYGGGVYVDGGGTFTMTGGSIVGCTATGKYAYGGGVFVSKNGTFTMTGGRIVGCTAVASYAYGMAFGGGIRNDGFKSDIGCTTLSGTAEIRDCHAKGGITPNGGGISDAGTLTISGDVKIIGCTAGGSGSDAMWVSSNNDSSITGGTFYGSITDRKNRISGITVKYHLNSNEDYATQVVQSGDKITLPDPTKDGCTFDGWYKDGTKWDSDTTVTENLTLTGYLYALVTDESTLIAALEDTSVGAIRLTKDITLSSGNTGIKVTNGRPVILDLNGYVLDLGKKYILISHSIDIMPSRLTIMDSRPDETHKFTPDTDGLWVRDETGGDKIVKGGIIYGGGGEGSGGAMTVGLYCIVTMNGGNIVGCEAGDSGGAVNVASGTFIMNGGNIVGCRADNYGGGVYASGAFTMTGGMIADCTANKGSGVYLKDDMMNAGGGTVDGTVVVTGGDYRSGVIQSLADSTGATLFKQDVTVTNGSEIKHGIFYGTVSVGSSDEGGKISGGIFNGPVNMTDGSQDNSISGGTFNDTVTVGVGKVSGGTFEKDVVVNDIDGRIRPELVGGTFNGLIINKSAYAAFAGAYSPLGIVGEKPIGANGYNYCTVTFAPNGGNMPHTTRYFLQGRNISGEIKPDPRTGYTFAGWYKADGTAWDYAKDTVTENITLYAKWIPHTYTVTFDSTGGSEVITKTMDVAYGEQLGDMPVPIRAGYFFCGWYDAMVGGKCYGGSDGKSTSQYDKTENCTLYAQWKINQYTITFDTAGGSKIASITQDYGTTITAPANPTREGYTFIDWDKKIPATMPAEDITITAQWKDIEKPTGEIRVGTSKWKTFLNNITFGLFFKDTQTVTITAADNSGETVKVEYLLSAKKYTKAELDGMTFTAYTAPFGINPDNEYIIYVRLTDKTGNTDYICSDGIVLDGTIPVIGGIENGKTYCEAQTVTVYEKYINTDTVTVNGTKVTLDKNNSFILSAADGEQKIVVIDKAGNKAEMTVMVNNGHTFGEWQPNGDGTHTHRCKISGCNGFETKECSGGTATCTEKAKCEVCGDSYGEKNPANHNGGKQEWTKTETAHEKKWNCCGAVTVASEAHEWADGVCRECGYECLHTDDDTNHICDICGKIYSNHRDTDKNHVCDYCGKTISNHEDTDKNHICDYCDKIISNHKDTDKNHICDFCDKIISNHEDKDKNHICDYCGKTISNHEDTDKNHICDFCGKTISNHDDTDKNHICNYCGKVITNHTGGKATCKDKAICDYCGKAYGELDAINHANLKHVPAKAATKEAEGNIEYWYCEGCDKYYSDAEALNGIVKGSILIMKLTDEPKSPKTGDNSSHMPWTALLFIGGGVCAALTLKRRKAGLTRR